MWTLVLDLYINLIYENIKWRSRVVNRYKQSRLDPTS